MKKLIVRFEVSAFNCFPDILSQGGKSDSYSERRTQTHGRPPSLSGAGWVCDLRCRCFHLYSPSSLFWLFMQDFGQMRFRCFLQFKLTRAVAIRFFPFIERTDAILINHQKVKRKKITCLCDAASISRSDRFRATGQPQSRAGR
jgi:hypothetical protein